jgi:hypothetical protein
MLIVGKDDAFSRQPSEIYLRSISSQNPLFSEGWKRPISALWNQALRRAVSTLFTKNVERMETHTLWFGQRWAALQTAGIPWRNEFTFATQIYDSGDKSEVHHVPESY